MTTGKVNLWCLGSVDAAADIATGRAVVPDYVKEQLNILQTVVSSFHWHTGSLRGAKAFADLRPSAAQI